MQVPPKHEGYVLDRNENAVALQSQVWSVHFVREKFLGVDDEYIESVLIVVTS